MAWIKTILPGEADGPLRAAYEAQRSLYPEEYATPVPAASAAEAGGGGGGIVASHSLIPEALHHAFATFGVLLSPDLPLTRRQQEMIATAVSAANRCVY